MTEEPSQDAEIHQLLSEIFQDGSGEALDVLLQSVEDPELAAQQLREISEHEGHVFGLAVAWRQRYQMTADTNSLDQAIAEFERSAQMISPEHFKYAQVMTEIGLTVQLRFELTGARADAERAVEALAAAYDIPVEEPTERAIRASNLGIALQNRYHLTDQGDDLDAAVELFQATIRDLPSNSSAYGTVGNALRVRYLRTRDRADLDRAIAAEEQAVALDAEGGAPRVLNHFGLAMELLFDVTEDPADLDRAIELFTTAASRVRENDYDQVIFSANLGRLLWTRYHLSADRADLEAATAAYELVLKSNYQPYGQRPPQVVFSYPFMLLELLGPGDTLVPAPEAVAVVRAFDDALETFPAGDERHDRLLSGRRAARARLLVPGRSEEVRLGGRSASVLTGDHRGSVRRVVTILPEGGEVLIGVGAHPLTVRFADTMSYVDRAYPDGDTYTTWLAVRLSAERREPTREIVLRYHADASVSDRDLALDALRCTAGPPVAYGPYTPRGMRLPALVLSGFFSGAERHLVLIGEDVEAWEGIATDPVEAMAYFITALSAAVTAVSHAQVVGVQGGVVQYYGDLGEPRPPSEIAEEVLDKVYAVDPDKDGPWAPAGYDNAGREALTWNASGSRVMETFEQTGDPDLLPRAVGMFRTAVEVLPQTHPHRTNHLINLAVMYDWLFEARDDIAALRESTRLWREIANAPDAPWRHRFQLGLMLTIQGEQLHDPDLLAEAVIELRSAAGSAEMGSLDEVDVLATLSSAHRLLSWLTGDATAADEAVAVGRRAVSTRDDHPERLDHLDVLAEALRAHAELTGDQHALAEAVELHRRVLEETDPGDPKLSARLHNLGLTLASRSAEGDFEEALRVLRQAVHQQSTTEADQRRATYLATLAAALVEQYQKNHDRELLDEALTAQREAVELTPLGAGVHLGRLLKLTTLLDLRYERSGSDAALEERVAIIRDLVTRHPDYPDGPRLLGQVLTARYRRHGELGDLADAIETLRTATARPDPDALTLNDLALALHRRHSAVGDLAALAESAELTRRAVALTPDDSPHLPGLLSNLADSCRMLFERSEDLALLNEAIDTGRRAFAALATGAVMDRVGVLTNLGLALMGRAHAVGDEAAGAEAVNLLRQAVELLPPDHPDRGLYLSNLSVALAAHDPERALDAARRAVETTPYGAARAERLMNLLVRLAERSPDSLGEIIQTARGIVDIDLAPPLMRISAAGMLGGLLAGRADWAEAAQIYTLAVELLPAVAPRDLARADQEHGLGRLGPLAEDGAACAIRSGDPELALRLLEQGRGVLLGQALDDRSDISALRHRSVDLAERFERLRDRLSDPGTGTGTDRVRLAHEWREVLEEIRSAPDWSDFLRPPPVSELLPQAGHGPIVVINPSSIGSDALIVQPSGVRVVPLPHLRPEALLAQIAVFRERQRTTGDINEVLRWLWDTIADPVLTALGLTQVPKGARWPRLWWCPAGPLALLPLHAAGHHDDGRAVLDRTISSYTPTIRALRHARSRAVRGGADARDIVVVSVPAAPGTVPLPGVRLETENLVRRFPSSTVLAGEDATRDRVLATLATHRVAHFACHAAADPIQPSHGHLVLWDHEEHPLTVLELSRRDLGRAQLAYLSACETAGGSPTLANEALHITAACQLAGFPHVIGTLWPISDRFAARTADEVYAALTRRGRVSVAKAPAALHEVVRRARQRHPNRAGLWAAFLHYGP
ncbi:CHAT domain-containing protein [Streptosporangium longisporum]|uniref:CHAT domain-containing protein n=1 Tax=Streptosporangium longisporum TaxID=46187 RepID=A0ABP6KME8_9ACTN